MSEPVPKVPVLLSPDEVGMLIEVATRERERAGEGSVFGEPYARRRTQVMCERILDACQQGFAAYCAPKAVAKNDGAKED